ncbi:hypothetical protein U1Q18_052445 [Sarracenia purpurea var. burkii]
MCHFISLPLETSIDVNSSSQKESQFSSLPWSFIFQTTLYLIWKWRNQWFYGPTLPNSPTHTILLLVQQNFIARTMETIKNRDVRIRWYPPNTGWVKFNVDAAFIGNYQTAAVGVCRDCQGN